MGFAYDTGAVNALIRPYLPERAGLQKTVIDAMDDAVEAGGKRIRPILMYESYRFFCRLRGKEPEDAEIAPFMAGMEMMHSSSLIHDDLPCMDNDTLRRGRPTTWVVYGEDMATLAGDALMVECFAVMADAVRRSKDPARAAQAMHIMAVKAGVAGMIGGQTVDVEQTGKPLDAEQLDFIYRLKTGALLEASMTIGAVLGGADEKETEAFGEIARKVGMAFQIRDDILDEISTTEELGKPVHSDEENGKTTYVTLFGLEKADEAVSRYSREAERLLEGLGGDSTVLGTLIEGLVNRKK